jgi:hypothetical protein
MNFQKKSIMSCQWLRNTLRVTSVFIVLFLAATCSNAQSVTNTDHAVNVIVMSADSVLKSNGVQGFKLEFGHPTPIRIKLIKGLMDLGYRVYEMPTETTEITTLTVDPLLTYRYVNGGRSGSNRIVDGTIAVTLTRRDGSVVATNVDRIEIIEPVNSKPSDLEDGVWPMASFASIDDGGRRRSVKRILEPALIISTVAVTVFLLFNVRSQ